MKYCERLLKELNLKKNEKNLSICMDLIGLWGIGKTTFLKKDFAANKYIIKVENNQLALEYKRAEKIKEGYNDIFLSGVLSGIIQTFCNKEINLEETACIIKGENYCLFENCFSRNNKVI